MILVNSQWQGGADITTYHAAYNIVQNYLTGLDYYLVPVDDTEISIAKENSIIGLFRHKEAI